MMSTNCTALQNYLESKSPTMAMMRAVMSCRCHNCTTMIILASSGIPQQEIVDIHKSMPLTEEVT